MPTSPKREFAMKKVTITILNQIYERSDWAFDFDSASFAIFFEKMSNDLKKLEHDLVCLRNTDVTITVKSYADLLNCIKVSTDNSMGNHCIGHCLGKSEHLDIMEDIEAAIRRIVFAPETIPPANEFRKVCHNCGCGC